MIKPTGIDLDALAARMTYVGSPEHKTQPHLWGNRLREQMPPSVIEASHENRLRNG